ncbi:MAG TPA: hypothetical protein DCZ93_00565 [Elusimicrobia bacterium]|nr:hypothetical protein [Elusimicrobiota bacterium]
MVVLAATVMPAPSWAQHKNYSEVVDGCRANIEPDKLSPRKAEECIRDFHDDLSILARLRQESPGEASEILAYNSALKDYKKALVSYTGVNLCPYLDRLMSGSICPLCDLGLGPEPERSFSWAERYLPPDKAGDFKSSVRTWDALGRVRIPALQKKGWSKEQWNAQTPLARYRTLVAWSKEASGLITAIQPPSNFPDKHYLTEAIPVLQEDVLDEPLKVKLGEYLKNSRAEPAAAGPSAASKATSDKVNRTAAAAAALAGMSTGEQAGQLDNLYSGSVHRSPGQIAAGGGSAAEYIYKPLSPGDIDRLGTKLLEQKADGSLSGPLAKAIAGTKAGDELLAFYKDKDFRKAGANKLAFGFKPMKVTKFGGWNWRDEDIKLNSEHVNAWMKKNAVTPEMLLEGDPGRNKHLAGLSEYLAPTFVHESTHQRQTATDKRDEIDLVKYRGKAGKSNAYYQMEKETEAFSMESSFSAEKYAEYKKAGRGDAYLERLDAFNKKNMQIYIKQGVDGIRLSNHKAYYDKESLDGHAAKEFLAEKDAAGRLQELQTRIAVDRASLSDDELAEMRKLRQQLDAKLGWYSITMRDAVKAEDKLNAWREEIRLKLSGNKSLKESPVPGILAS